MTDKVYLAKIWLMRADELDLQWKRTRDKIMFIQDKLNGGVSKYYGSGKGDPISAQASHEDLLLEYSMLRERFELEINRCLHEDNITLIIIERVNNPLHRSILTAKYICRISFKEFSKNSHIELKKSQIYEQHKKALEEIASILESEKPEVFTKSEVLSY